MELQVQTKASDSMRSCRLRLARNHPRPSIHGWQKPYQYWDKPPTGAGLSIPRATKWFPQMSAFRWHLLVEISPAQARELKIVPNSPPDCPCLRPNAQERRGEMWGWPIQSSPYQASAKLSLEHFNITSKANQPKSVQQVMIELALGQ